MFKSLRRLQLKRRGLMTEKTRRKQSEREWVERFRESGVVRALSLLLFASGLAVLIVGAADSCEGVFGARWRAFAISGVVLVAAVAHFYLNHPQSFRRNSRVVLIFGQIRIETDRDITFAVQAIAPGWIQTDQFRNSVIRQAPFSALS